MKSHPFHGALLGLMLGALLLTVAGPAAAAPSTDDIHATLGIESVPAEYVILVDTSSSMKGARYAAVRRGTLSLLAALAPDDHVSLVTFDAGPAVVWDAPAGRSPQKIVDKLPKEPLGGNTDIGLALERAVRLLKRDGTPTIATVVLLTDGVHDPRAGSAYPFDKGWAWDELGRDARRLRKDSLSGYAVPLAGATGARLLGKVVPGSVVLDPSTIDRSTRMLEEPKRKVQAAKARRLLDDDLARGVTATWPAEAGSITSGEQQLTVTLQATTKHIPIEVRGLVAASSRPELTVRVDTSTVTLEPGRSAPVTLTVSWDPGPRSWKPWATTSVAGTLSLSGSAGTPWAEPLATDGIAFTPRLSGTASPVRGEARHGRPGWWLAGLVAAVLVALLGRLLVRNRLVPTMLGTLVATVPARDQRSTMVLSGRRSTISKATAGISGSGFVRGIREGLLSREPGIEISYTHDGSPGHQETRRLRPGDSVTVSGVEFRWERAR